MHCVRTSSVAPSNSAASNLHRWLNRSTAGATGALHRLAAAAQAPMARSRGGIKQRGGWASNLPSAGAGDRETKRFLTTPGTFSASAAKSIFFTQIQHPPNSQTVSVCTLLALVAFCRFLHKLLASRELRLYSSVHVDIVHKRSLTHCTPLTVFGGAGPASCRCHSAARPAWPGPSALDLFLPITTPN